MAKAIYLDSVAGVAGDMFTAAFVDAGVVSLDELNGLCEALGLEGVSVTAEKAVRATVMGTRITVECDSDKWKDRFSAGRSHSHDHSHSHKHEHAHSHDHAHDGEHHHHERDQHHHNDETTNLVLDHHSDHWHVHYGEIDRFLAGSSLKETTRERARAILRLLGEAEAAVHGIELDKAAFHELGTIDSIMDVVMAAHCIEKIAANTIFATPLKPGRGMINIAHGTHPVPPPATARLLQGLSVAPVPPAIAAENIELSTPTGVAIIRHLEPSFVSEPPAGVMMAEGRGSGTKDLGNYPNVFRLVVLETGDKTELPYLTDKVVEVACNIDDDTAEHLAWMCEQLLLMGALEVWQTPSTGKKGRSMVCLRMLAAEGKFRELAAWILQNGTTFGIRYREWDRLKLDPQFEERDIDGTTRTFKIGRDAAGNKIKEKPEFDSWKSGR